MNCRMNLTERIRKGLACCLQNSFKDTPFLLNLHIVNSAFRHIAAILAGFLVFQHLYAQESLDAELDRYEEMCRMSMELKDRMADGEQISRNEAEVTIGLFVAMNKRLKARESDMNVAQRRRFNDIRDWFRTGVRPFRPEPLPPVIKRLAGTAESEMSGINLLTASFPVSEKSVPDTLMKSVISYTLLAEISAPYLSYGLRFGVVGRRGGGYVSVRSNYCFDKADYSCFSDGSLPNGSRIWSSGVERQNNLSVTAGAMCRAAEWLDVYAGAGYGRHILYWQDIESNWVEVSDWTCRGLSAEAGLIVSFRKLAFSAGLSTVAFKVAAFTMGVGLQF